MCRCDSVPGQPKRSTYAATNEPVIRPKSTSTSTSRRQCTANASTSRTSAPGARPPLDVGEEARELDEQHERDEHADDREALVVEDVVGEARAAERGRDQREQQRRRASRTGRSARAGATSGRGRPGRSAGPRAGGRSSRASCRGSARRGSRIGSRSVATVVPATFQLAARPSAASAKPSTCEPESPMKTSALPPRAQVERQEPGARARAGEREREMRVVRVDGDGVDREEPERDRRRASPRGRPCCRAG